MKKKILLSMIIASLLVCLFAIVVSAASYDTTRKVTLDDKTDCALYDADGYALTWYMNGDTLTSKRTIDLINVNSSGWISYKTDVEGFGGASYVVIANFQEPNYTGSVANAIVGMDITYRYSTVLEYVYFADEITKFNKWYTFSEANKLKVAEFTENSQLTSVLQYMFHKCAALKSFYFPAGVVTIPDGDKRSYGYMFGCDALESVTFAKDSQLTTIGTYAFMKCPNLTSITIPDSVTTIKDGAVRESGIINSPFTENSKCTSLGNNVFYKCASLEKVIIPKGLTQTQNETGNDGGLFDRCTSLTTVTFAEGSQMTFIGNRTFNGCSSLVNINFPERLEKIGNSAFHSTALVSVKLPNTLKEIDGRAFQNCKSLVEVRLGASFTKSLNISVFYLSTAKYFYIPKTAVSFNEHCFGTAQGGMGSNDMVFFYCGTQAEFANITFDANNQRVSGATIINWGFDAEGNKIENPTDDYYKTLATTNNKCYIVCGYNTCDAFYDGEHTETGEPTYEYKGEEYLSNYVEILSCSICGKSDSEKLVCGPLFINKGYAKEENGSLFTYGIVIDKDEIAKYVAHTGKVFNYGMVVASGDLVNDGALFDESTKAIDGTIIIDVTTTKYTVYQLKMTGIKDTQKDLSVYACAYVIDGAAVSYIGEETTDSAVAISYNQIKALITNNLAGNGEATENTDAA